MTATPHPTWSSSEQADLLELVAQGSPTGTADAEWNLYVEALRDEAVRGAGDIDPNGLRDRVRGRIAPRRISAFASRALARGLVVYSGAYVESTDTEGGNRGKPCRVMRAQLALYRDSS